MEVTPPVLNHPGERAVVRLGFDRVRFTLVPDGAKYGHVYEWVDHGIEEHVVLNPRI
jgi:hypothetical protein